MRDQITQTPIIQNPFDMSDYISLASSEGCAPIYRERELSEEDLRSIDFCGYIVFPVK